MKNYNKAYLTFIIIIICKTYYYYYFMKYISVSELTSSLDGGVFVWTAPALLRVSGAVWICWGKITVIISPETTPQEESVCPVSTRISFPFRDRLNSTSDLCRNRQTHETCFRWAEMKVWATWLCNTTEELKPIWKIQLIVPNIMHSKHNMHCWPSEYNECQSIPDQKPQN